jgi:hypothetical protein
MRWPAARAKSRAPISKRKWRQHAALSADKVRGLKNSKTVRSFAHTLSVALQQLHMCRDNAELVILCFADQRMPKRSTSVWWGAVAQRTRGAPNRLGESAQVAASGPQLPEPNDAPTKLVE